MKYPRRTTSGAAGNGQGTTIKYLQCTTNGAAGNNPGTTIKYLRRTMSGDAVSSLGRFQRLLLHPFTTSALHLPCFVRSFFANKQNYTAEVRGLVAQCDCLGVRTCSLCSDPPPISQRMKSGVLARFRNIQ
jgi:hypothetical protein